jgi:hypothetical protein
MDITDFIARIRDHYVEQFEVFADKQRRSCSHYRGGSEIKLRLSETSKLFERLYCADFVKTDVNGQNEIIEFQPENILTFKTISGSFGAAAYSIEHLRWDDVLIHHDLAELPPLEISGWFRCWFDVDDERHVSHAPLSFVIHSLGIEPRVISIDFGTAPPEAFWEMLGILQKAGALAIRISSSRDEAEAKADA